MQNQLSTAFYCHVGYFLGDAVTFKTSFAN